LTSFGDEINRSISFLIGLVSYFHVNKKSNSVSISYCGSELYVMVVYVTGEWLLRSPSKQVSRPSHGCNGKYVSNATFWDEIVQREVTEKSRVYLKYMGDRYSCF
jgi:hypothetical protein